MLLGVYVIWVTAIALIITSPSLSFLNVLAGAMVLFIWLPYWARVNWTLVAGDIPAPLATVTVSLILILVLGLRFYYDISAIEDRLIKSGWLDHRFFMRSEGFDFVVSMIIFFSIQPAWRWFRRVFTQTPSKATEPPTTSTRR